MSEFEKELEHLINRYSMENASNTPDFILAQYLSGCLAIFATAVQQRETWYGRDARPGHIVSLEEPMEALQEQSKRIYYAEDDMEIDA